MQTFRTTMKMIYAGYLVAAVIESIAIYVHFTYMADQRPVLPLAGLLAFLGPVGRHLRRQFTSLEVGDGKLKFESGILSRTRRTFLLDRVQDVRVDQTLMQRMLGVGSVRVETAGEAGGLLIPDLDSPQSVADTILHAAPRSRAQGQ